MPKKLQEAIRWTTTQVPGDAATASVTLAVGDVGEEGPRATIVSGQHGDEGPWGALATRGLLKHDVEALRGRLRIVYTANPLAAAADARSAPLDHLDLNTCFPGSPTGSHTQRLAAVMAGLVEDSDLVIDLHGGGSWCLNAFTYRFEGDEALAAAVGAPFAVDIPPPPGGLIEHARRHGARVLAVEMGGRGSSELVWRDRITAGMERVLRMRGVLVPKTAQTEVAPPVTVTGMKVLRPSGGGIFLPTLGESAIGAVVEEGTELGQVLDLGTLAHRETFLAPYPRTAILLLRPHIGVIEGGAMTYVVGEPA